MPHGKFQASQLLQKYNITRCNSWKIICLVWRGVQFCGNKDGEFWFWRTPPTSIMSLAHCKWFNLRCMFEKFLIHNIMNLKIILRNSKCYLTLNERKKKEKNIKLISDIMSKRKVKWETLMCFKKMRCITITTVTNLVNLQRRLPCHETGENSMMSRSEDVFLRIPLVPMVHEIIISTKIS